MITIDKMIGAGVALLIASGSIFLIGKIIEEPQIKEKESISYMERAGTGVVLGKSLDKNSGTEVAIQFKDTILYSVNKEWYYLLKEGDSIQVKEGKIKFERKNENLSTKKIESNF